MASWRCRGDAAPRALRLVAPESLPAGFASGIYREREGPGYPSGPSRAVPGRTEIRFEPAAGARLRHAYTAGESDRDVYYRWPLEFATGDGPGRVSVVYPERSPSGAECTRTLSQVFAPVALRDPGVRLHRPRVSDRIVLDERDIPQRRVRVRVTGRTRRATSRPVRIDVYEGDADPLDEARPRALPAPVDAIARRPC